MGKVAGTLPVSTQLAYHGARKTARYGYIDGLSINNPASDASQLAGASVQRHRMTLTPRRQW